MKIKLTRLTAILLAFSIILSFNAFASTVVTGDSVQTAEGIGFEYSINLSEYPDFNIDEYSQYIPLLEEYGVNIDEVIAIIPVGEDASPSTRGWHFPGGVLVLTGIYLSDYQWMLSVLNIGVCNVLSMEADVKLINNVSGLIVNSQRLLGGLNKGGSISESYSSYAGKAIDCVAVTVVGMTDCYDYVNMGGMHYR